MCKDPESGPCLVWRSMWLEQSEGGGEGKKVRIGRGWSRSYRVLWATGKTLAFTLREVGAPEASRQRRDETNSGAQNAVWLLLGGQGTRRPDQRPLQQSM